MHNYLATFVCPFLGLPPFADPLLPCPWLPAFGPFGTVAEATAPERPPRPPPLYGTRDFYLFLRLYGLVYERLRRARRLGTRQRRRGPGAGAAAYRAFLGLLRERLLREVPQAVYEERLLECLGPGATFLGTMDEWFARLLEQVARPISGGWEGQGAGIRSEGAPEAAPEAVRQAVGGGCQSGLGRLLSVTNAIEPGAWCQGDSGWALAGAQPVLERGDAHPPPPPAPDPDPSNFGIQGPFCSSRPPPPKPLSNRLVTARFCAQPLFESPVTAFATAPATPISRLFLQPQPRGTRSGRQTAFVACLAFLGLAQRGVGEVPGLCVRAYGWVGACVHPPPRDQRPCQNHRRCCCRTF